MSTAINENLGIPLCVNKDAKIAPGHQLVMRTGTTLYIPEGLYGEVVSPWHHSQMEPSVAPGILIPGHGEIDVLLANLTSQNIKVKKY